MITHRLWNTETRIPEAVGIVTDSGWIIHLMASRTAPKGKGTEMLKGILEDSEDTLRLGCNWNNIAMFKSALKAGMELEGTDINGFVFIRREKYEQL